MSDQIDKEIAALEKELAGLRRQKLAELQSQVTALHAALNGEEPATPRRGRPPGKTAGTPAKRGRPAGRASKGWAASLVADSPAPVTAPGKTRRRKRGKHITDVDALAMLSKVVSAAGSEGVSALKTAESSGVPYPRARTLMDKHFKKSGSGKSTRYTLK